MPDHQGRVSVIIPTHNRAQHLSQALASVAQQSYAAIEIIVVANGCNDEVDKVIKQFEQKFQQAVVYLRFDQALGGAKARNIGIDKAQGEYVAFLDDDDYWHTDKIATQVQYLNEKNCALVGSNFVYVCGKNSQKLAGSFRQNAITLNDLYFENALGGFSLCLTKKSYIGTARINESLRALQDWDLWLKILLNTGLDAYVSQAYYAYYRIDGDRISSQYSSVLKAQQTFLTLWQQQLTPPSIAFHQMRIRCLMSKTKIRTKWCYLFDCAVIIKAILRSPLRYNAKKYYHYLALPLISIDGIRAKYIKSRKN